MRRKNATRETTELARLSAEERAEVQKGYETLKDALRAATVRADEVLERLKRRVPKRPHLKLVSR